MRKLYLRIHRYFAKTNFRLLLLLLIGLASTIAVSFTQQQQLSQKQNNFSQVTADNVICDLSGVCVEKCGNTTCTTDRTCIKSTVNGEPTCTLKGGVPPGWGCSTENNTPNSAACDSGVCGADLKCTGLCGATACSSTQTCVRETTVDQGSYDLCITKASRSSTQNCMKNDGTANPEACTANLICNNTTKKCTAASSSGGSGGGTTTCNGSDYACNNKCYSGCGSIGYTCTSTGAVCQNGGCSSSQVAIGSTCCPAGTKELCSDGKCGPCNLTIPTKPQPAEFSSTPTVVPDCTSAVLKWGASADASYYVAFAYIDPSKPVDNGNGFKSSNLNALEYKFTGLEKGQFYTFAVEAYSTTNSTKRSFSITAATTTTCSATTGTSNGTSPKTPAESAINNSGDTSPISPKAGTPTTTAVATSPSLSNKPPTTLSIALTLPGVGVGSKDKNANPKRSERDVKVVIRSSEGAQVFSSSAKVQFDPNSGLYKGSIDLGKDFQSGAYSVRVNVDNSLVRESSGININAGQTNIVPTTTLIAGDLNNDNTLDLIDYNAIISCIGGKNTCQDTQRSDFNDNGIIDEQDLNILYSGFKNRTGE